MKYFGFDLGSVTLGVAISDEMGILARTYDTFRFAPDDYGAALKYVMSICDKEGIKNCILGYPKHMNGDIGLRANISLSFKEKIEAESDIKVILWDERLSTVSVDRVMISANLRREKRKEKKDELAAVVILQDYLDYKN